LIPDRNATEPSWGWRWTGEDHAVSEYESALDADISDRLRTVVRRQMTDVTSTRDRVKALADQN
jgi:hypothetical protein